ncbi:MAG: hypothetical protein HY270_12600 [Deltaproteobacteria bacterium]|nr:hypothetical protein [Deltaproteobacteria bacterium]
MTINPTAAPITVTSNAHTRCWDLFGVIWCNLKVEMESSDGQKVSDP